MTASHFHCRCDVHAAAATVDETRALLGRDRGFDHRGRGGSRSDAAAAIPFRKA